MAERSEPTRLTASCHCKANQYSFTIPQSALPLLAYLCHCNISRRISGLLFTSYVAIPPGNPPPDLSNLTAYVSSNILTRRFCKTCSTQLFLEYSADGAWWVSTGTLDRSDGIVDFNGHMWIEDTHDGGGSDWIPTVGSKPLERWLVAPHESPSIALGWNAPDERPLPASGTEDDRLHAHCHCNGVQFFITRPNAATLTAKSPYADLLVPYNSGRDASNPTNEPWWLSSDKRRYLAGTCACTSCRLISGFDIQTWAFVPTANIVLPDGSPFPDERLWGTMRSYRSSEKVTRRFCGVCGANVFWDGDVRPSLVDVSVGLLDAGSGARAEEWLEWCVGRVSFREEGFNMGLVEGLERGLREWDDGKRKKGVGEE